MMTRHAPGSLRIALFNPNTNVQATHWMLESARAALPPHVHIEGRTATRGVPLITNEQAQQIATEVVLASAPALEQEGFDAIVVAGFGDPGLAALRGRVHIPVVGLAESSILEAGAQGRPYSIVTITPDLHAGLRLSAMACGQHRNLVSVRFTAGDPVVLAHDARALQDALLQTSHRAVDEDGAQAIVIGGGPLVRAANAIAPLLDVPLVEPVAAAVRRARALCAVPG